MNSQSIAEVMKQKTQAARDEIEAMLWADHADLDAIAAAALRGGLTPADVGQIEQRVSEAKATLDAAAKSDLDKLRADHERAQKVEAKAVEKADVAQALADDAADERVRLENRIAFARQKVVELVGAVRRGAVPRHAIPATLAGALAAADAAALRSEGELARRVRIAELKSLKQNLERAYADAKRGTERYASLRGEKFADEKRASVQRVKAAQSRLEDCARELETLSK